MDIEDLKKRAGITEATDDPKELWREFNRISTRLESALRRTAVDTHGDGQAPEGMLNPLQVNDIAFSIEKLNEQLERLDKVYRWREYMAQRKARAGIK